MSNVIACYKWVLDEADIRINADLSVDTDRAKGKISDYDRNVIEAAVRARSFLNGKAIGLTFGDAKAKQSLKDALSRGLDEVYYVNTGEAIQVDASITAKALAEAIKKIDEVGLIICAEGASDTYARQTASRIGAALDIPVVTSVINIKIDGNTLTAVRKLEDCLQTVKVELPVVVAVLPEINPAPIPGLKAVMAAGKKPVTEIKFSELNVDQTLKNKVNWSKGYVMNRKNVIFKEGEPAEKVKELIAALRKEGVL